MSKTTIFFFYFLKGSVWETVNQTSEKVNLDFNQLEEFMKKTNPIIYATENKTAANSDEAKSIASFSNETNSSSGVNLLDAKQNMNLNVYLTKIKSPLPSFIKLIEQGESSQIGIDNLSCLKRILPDQADVKEKIN